jgi:hypothetical protein
MMAARSSFRYNPEMLHRNEPKKGGAVLPFSASLRLCARSISKTFISRGGAETQRELFFKAIHTTGDALFHQRLAEV